MIHLLTSTKIKGNKDNRTTTPHCDKLNNDNEKNARTDGTPKTTTRIKAEASIAKNNQILCPFPLVKIDSVFER